MAAPAPKRVVFYYRGVAYPLNMYLPATKNQVIRTLWTTFGLRDSITLANFQTNVKFLNAEGEMVMWSPGSIPAETQLHVHLDIPVVGSDPVQEFTWDEKVNALPSHGYELSDGNKTIKATLSKHETPQLACPLLPANVLFTKGKHHWRVRFSHNVTYMSCGLIRLSEKEYIGREDAWSNAFGLFKAHFHMDLLNLLDPQFDLDMDKRICTVKRGDGRADLVVQDLPAEGVIPVVYIKLNASGCSATLLFD